MWVRFSPPDRGDHRAPSPCRFPRTVPELRVVLDVPEQHDQVVLAFPRADAMQDVDAPREQRNLAADQERQHVHAELVRPDRRMQQQAVVDERSVAHEDVDDEHERLGQTEHEHGDGEPDLEAVPRFHRGRERVEHQRPVHPHEVRELAAAVHAAPGPQVARAEVVGDELHVEEDKVERSAQLVQQLALAAAHESDTKERREADARASERPRQGRLVLLPRRRVQRSERQRVPGSANDVQHACCHRPSAVASDDHKDPLGRPRALGERRDDRLHRRHRFLLRGRMARAARKEPNAALVAYRLRPRRHRVLLALERDVPAVHEPHDEREDRGHFVHDEVAEVDRKCRTRHEHVVLGVLDVLEGHGDGHRHEVAARGGNAQVNGCLVLKVRLHEQKVDEVAPNDRHHDAAQVVCVHGEAHDPHRADHEQKPELERLREHFDVLAAQRETHRGDRRGHEHEREQRQERPHVRRSEHGRDARRDAQQARRRQGRSHGAQQQLLDIDRGVEARQVLAHHDVVHELRLRGVRARRGAAQAA